MNGDETGSERRRNWYENDDERRRWTAAMNGAETAMNRQRWTATMNGAETAMKRQQWTADLEIDLFWAEEPIW